MNGGVVEQALSELKLADHMIYMTLPLLNDRMIFLNAIVHVHKAISMVVNKFLTKEYDYKRLDSLPEKNERISFFLTEYSNKLDVSSYTKAIKAVDSFIKFKDLSSVKMKRGDKFVLITPEYETVSISESEIKAYIKKVEEFINKLGGKLNER